MTAANASLCSGAKGALDARNHSWTGVTCDPAGHVACINLCARSQTAGPACYIGLQCTHSKVVSTAESNSTSQAQCHKHPHGGAVSLKQPQYCCLI